MIVATSDSVKIVAILALWFLLLALVVVARAVLRKVPPMTKRYRVGIFVERDRGEDDERGTGNRP